MRKLNIDRLKSSIQVLIAIKYIVLYNYGKKVNKFKFKAQHPLDTYKYL